MNKSCAALYAQGWLVSGNFTQSIISFSLRQFHLHHPLQYAEKNAGRWQNIGGGNVSTPSGQLGILLWKGCGTLKHWFPFKRFRLCVGFGIKALSLRIILLQEPRKHFFFFFLPCKQIFSQTISCQALCWELWTQRLSKQHPRSYEKYWFTQIVTPL